MENISSASLQVLVQTVQELSLARDMSRVMELVRTAARSLTGADGATFVLKEEANCYYADENAIGPLWKGSRFPMASCISGWAMLNRKAAVIEDVFADPRIPANIYSPTFVKSLAMVPIRTLDPIGAIGNYWATTRKPTEQEVWLLQSLADITAVTIENVNNYSHLEERVKERTKQLEVANQDLEAFSYTVAHDLRAPLRIMAGYSDMLQRGETLSDEHKRITQRIIASGKKLGDLIDRLLHFYASQRNELKKVPVVMQKLVEELTEDVKLNEPDRNISFHLHSLPDVVADVSLIRQAFTNLLSNAVKYTAHKTDTIIEIGGEQKEAYSVFYIKDNGIGFNMEDYNKLFGVFKRLPGAEKFEGSGIGLASVHRIIERHGGKVWAEAKPNEGATFYFSLPVL